MPACQHAFYILLIICLVFRSFSIQDPDPRKAEKYARLGDWDCRNCKSENEAEEIECKECCLDRGFSIKECGMPSDLWREYRRSYQAKIIYDTPEEIPEHAVRHLRTDMERFMYKKARTAVQKCIRCDIWDREYVNPFVLSKQLENLDMGAGISESVRKARIMDYLEHIYWNACMNLCEAFSGEDELFGYMHLLLYSRHYGGEEQVQKERLEQFKTKAGTHQIKGSQGDDYWVNPEEGFCTCLGFKYRNDCKHLKRKRFVTKKT